MLVTLQYILATSDYVMKIASTLQVCSGSSEFSSEGSAQAFSSKKRQYKAAVTSALVRATQL